MFNGPETSVIKVWVAIPKNQNLLRCFLNAKATQNGRYNLVLNTRYDSVISYEMRIIRVIVLS